MSKINVNDEQFKQQLGNNLNESTLTKEQIKEKLGSEAVVRENADGSIDVKRILKD